MKYKVHQEQSCRWKDQEDALGIDLYEGKSLMKALLIGFWSWIRWAAWDDPTHRRVFIERNNTGKNPWRNEAFYYEIWIVLPGILPRDWTRNR